MICSLYNGDLLPKSFAKLTKLVAEMKSNEHFSKKTRGGGRQGEFQSVKDREIGIPRPRK